MQNDEFDQGLICPSFNSYSDDKLAAVAAKVCREFSDMKLADESSSGEQRKPEEEEDDKNDTEDDDDEFEFVPFHNSGGEVFFDHNEIGGPVFPVFNRDLLFDGSQRDLTAAAAAKEEEDNYDIPSSSSSSEVDALEAVPPGMYCVWTPKPAAAEESRPEKCKKSRSTGTSSSRRWSLKDLLRRSNSEGGKDSLVLLTPSSSRNSENGKVNNKKPAGPRKSFVKGPSDQSAVSLAYEAFYVRNKTVPKDGYNKRRSYLPYRQDLIGFFASVNAMSRTFPAL